jgi:hypothetical protein
MSVPRGTRPILGPNVRSIGTLARLYEAKASCPATSRGRALPGS